MCGMCDFVILAHSMQLIPLKEFLHFYIHQSPVRNGLDNGCGLLALLWQIIEMAHVVTKVAQYCCIIV